MKTISKVGEIFKNFHSMIQTQFHTKIQILKTDNEKKTSLLLLVLILLNTISYT